MKNLNKKIITGFIFLSLFVAASPIQAAALSQGEKQTLLQDLKSQLLVLLIQRVEQLQLQLIEETKTLEKNIRSEKNETKKTSTEKKSTKKQLISTPKTSAEGLSSSGSSASDIASFEFTTTIEPFGDPIYISSAGADALDAVLVNASSNTESGFDRISVSSTAERVRAANGDRYYKFSGGESISFKLTTRPGAGDYYAEGLRLSIVNSDISSSGFRAVPITLSSKWQTSTVTLLN